MLDYTKMSLEELRTENKRLRKELALIHKATYALQNPKKKKSAYTVPKNLVTNWFLYVLECADDCYYIGITTDTGRRFEKHGKGKGAWFTKAHKPIRILEETHIGKITTAEAMLQEDKLAARYMMKYGTDKVRGGQLIQRDKKYFEHKINSYL